MSVIDIQRVLPTWEVTFTLRFYTKCKSVDEVVKYLKEWIEQNEPSQMRSGWFMTQVKDLQVKEVEK